MSNISTIVKFIPINNYNEYIGTNKILLLFIIHYYIGLWYFVFVFIFLMESGFLGLNKVDYDIKILRKKKQEKLS